MKKTIFFLLVALLCILTARLAILGGSYGFLRVPKNDFITTGLPFFLSGKLNKGRIGHPQEQISNPADHCLIRPRGLYRQEFQENRENCEKMILGPPREHGEKMVL